MGEEQKNLYDVLGVSRNAELSEIKKAYKELSKINHPDKPGGSEEKMKEINHAYEILSDDGKRQLYDLTGQTQEGGGGGPPPGGPFGFPGMPFGFGGGGFHMNVDIGDLFNMFSGRGQPGPRRPQKEAKGPDKIQELPLSLSDFYHGRRIHMELNRNVFCSECSGEGCLNWKTCSECKGMGVKEVMRQMGPGMMAVQRGPCGPCSGEGRLKGTPCEPCKGRGLVSSPKTLDVEIKPGSAPGDILTFEGMCSDIQGYEKAGDLKFRLLEANESLDVERDGIHLKSEFKISLSESLLGCSRRLENHPAGKLEFDIPAGIQNGESFQIPGKGMPGKNGDFGNLIVYIKVEVKEEERKVLESSKAILQSLFMT